MFKKIDKNLFSAILYLVLGALLAIFQGAVIGWAMYVLAGIFIISGALDVLKKNYTNGGVSLVIGVAIIILQIVGAAEIILKIIGILIAIKGVVSLLDSFKSKKTEVTGIVYTALTIIAGLLLIFATGTIIDIVLLIAGIILTPVGMILGSFLGAFLYEWYYTRQGAAQALKAAIGSFLGFITGTGIKTIVAVLIMWRIIVFL